MRAIMVARHLRREVRPVNLVEQSYRDGLEFFYTRRAGTLLWVDGERPAARARAVISEMARADEWGLRARDFNLPRLRAHASQSGPWSARAQIAFEIAMSRGGSQICHAGPAVADFPCLK